MTDKRLLEELIEDYQKTHKCDIDTATYYTMAILVDAVASGMSPLNGMHERIFEQEKSPWHTGTPTKDDWYFVLWRDTDDDWRRFSALLWNNLNKTWYDDVTPDCNWCDEYHAEVIAWMPIPPYKEKEDGRTD